MRKLLFGLIFLLGNLTLAAQDSEIVADRPDQANAPFLVPKGALQIETGFIVEKYYSKTIDQTDFTYNNTLIRIGVNENFELRINGGYYGTQNLSDDAAAPSKGFGSTSIGVKIKLAEAIGFWPHAAITTHVNLKTGSNDFRSTYTANDLALLLAYEFNSWTVTFNAGAKWNGDSPEAIFLYALSAEKSFGARWSAFIESYSFFPESHAADNRMDAGLTCKITPKIQWDLSGGMGLNRNSKNYYLSTGLSIRLFK